MPYTSSRPYTSTFPDLSSISLQIHSKSTIEFLTLEQVFKIFFPFSDKRYFTKHLRAKMSSIKRTPSERRQLNCMRAVNSLSEERLCQKHSKQQTASIKRHIIKHYPRFKPHNSRVDVWYLWPIRNKNLEKQAKYHISCDKIKKKTSQRWTQS